MSELIQEQECPYCGHTVEDHLSNWNDDDEEVKCDHCNKNYTVRAEYKFLGFEIKRLCQKCGEELFEDADADFCSECHEALID